MQNDNDFFFVSLDNYTKKIPIKKSEIFYNVSFDLNHGFHNVLFYYPETRNIELFNQRVSFKNTANPNFSTTYLINGNNVSFYFFIDVMNYLFNLTIDVDGYKRLMEIGNSKYCDYEFNLKNLSTGIHNVIFSFEGDEIVSKIYHVTNFEITEKKIIENNIQINNCSNNINKTDVNFYNISNNIILINNPENNNYNLFLNNLKEFDEDFNEVYNITNSLNNNIHDKEISFKSKHDKINSKKDSNYGDNDFKNVKTYQIEKKSFTKSSNFDLINLLKIIFIFSLLIGYFRRK